MASGTVSGIAKTLSMPPLLIQEKDGPNGLNFDPDALKAKYEAERDKRLCRNGINQYQPIKGSIVHYIKDHYATSFS